MCQNFVLTYQRLNQWACRWAPYMILYISLISTSPEMGKSKPEETERQLSRCANKTAGDNYFTTATLSHWQFWYFSLLRLAYGAISVESLDKELSFDGSDKKYSPSTRTVCPSFASNVRIETRTSFKHWMTWLKQKFIVSSIWERFLSFIHTCHANWVLTPQLRWLAIDLVSHWQWVMRCWIKKSDWV